MANPETTTQDPTFRVHYQLGLESWQHHYSYTSTPELAVDEVIAGAREAGEHLTMGVVEWRRPDGSWIDADVVDDSDPAFRWIDTP